MKGRPDDLFWLALSLVAMVIVLIAAKRLLSADPPKRLRWLPILAGLALMIPAGCAHHPPTAPTTAPFDHDLGAGWDDWLQTPGESVA